MAECPLDHYGFKKDRTCIDKKSCNSQKGFLYGKFCELDCASTKSPKSPYHLNGECLTICPDTYYGNGG